MSERITAANLDEAIETQMKQSESSWIRKTDGIDYKQARSSVFICMAVIPSLEIMLPLVVTPHILTELKYSFNMASMEAILLYPSTTTTTAGFQWFRMLLPAFRKALAISELSVPS